MTATILQIPSQSDFDSAIDELETFFNDQIDTYKDGDDPSTVRTARRKLQLISRLRIQYAATHRRRDTLFVSLAKAQTLAGGKLDVIKSVAAQHGFTSILTGFDEDMNYVREDTFSKIQMCDAFLGLWTDDFVVKRRGAANETFGPGVWMPLELGVALAAGKECRLLLQKDLTPELVTPVGNIVQRWFSDEDFEARATESISILRKEIGNPGPGSRPPRA